VNTVPVIGYLTRIELRRHWRALVLLGVITAGVVALTLACLAGAQRAETAFDRYLAEVRSPDAGAFGDPEAIEALAGVDGVEDVLDMDLAAVSPVSGSPEDFYPFVSVEDGAIPAKYYRLPVVEGRAADPAEPLEVALSERTARRLHVGVGDDLEVISFGPETAESLGSPDEADPDGPTLSFRVVGLVRDPGDIAARESDITLTIVTPAFREAYGPDVVGSIGGGSFVILDEGSTLSEITEAADLELELDPTFSANSFRSGVQPTMDTIASALRIFAAVVALAGVVAVTQAAARLQVTSGSDDPALGALGAGRSTRVLRVALPTMLAVSVGVVLGIAGAVALSPRFPIGLARRADPDVGLHVDLRVLAIGGLVALLSLAALTVGSAVWNLRIGDRRVPRPGRTARAAATAGAPPSAVSGLALATGSSGARSGIAMGGMVFGVLGVLAAFVFSASIEQLRDEPSLYGWGWDAVVEGADLADLGTDADGVSSRLAADPEVTALGAFYSQIPMTLDGEPDYATAVVPTQGTIDPVLVRGDLPVRVDELALGQDTLERVGAAVGDEIDVSFLGDATPMRITGVVALPVSLDGGSLASGAVISPAAFEAADLTTACEQSDSCTRQVAVRLADDVDPTAFAARYEDPSADVAVQLPVPPSDIDRLTAVEHLPRYLAVFLAVLAAAATSFTTELTMRQRRRDLAMLRVLGMTQRHMRSVVVIFVFALSLVGTAIGVGLGVIVGRQVWRVVASSVAVPFAPNTPMWAAVIVPIAALLLAQLVATRSRQAVARVPAARVLRAE
jgi:hypothetical protein